ncbi:hypothetical protein [Pontimicrobium sp. SW4]|uniref:Lipoprotein n=1 Tax=Pontimicrobium sp. SW4 TaxID=3153519 RepID=A0AAU7BPT9_9FLAO
MKNIYLYIVIIGISLFSCSNSNSGEKNSELAILKELHSDLVQNLTDINSNIESLKISKKANEIIISNIKSNIQYHDSLNFHFANLYPYLVFSPNETTFNYLKQIGMNSISNDSIRASISNLYGVRYGIYKYYESIYFVEHYINYIKPMFIAEFETFKIYGSFKPRNYNQFIKNPEYKRIMSYTKDVIQTFIFMQKGLKEDAENLISAIDKELKG